MDQFTTLLAQAIAVALSSISPSHEHPPPPPPPIVVEAPHSESSTTTWASDNLAPIPDRTVYCFGPTIGFVQTTLASLGATEAPDKCTYERPTPAEIRILRSNVSVVQCDLPSGFTLLMGAENWPNMQDDPTCFLVEKS